MKKKHVTNEYVGLYSRRAVEDAGVRVLLYHMKNGSYRKVTAIYKKGTESRCLWPDAIRQGVVIEHDYERLPAETWQQELSEYIDEQLDAGLHEDLEKRVGEKIEEYDSSEEICDEEW